LKQREGIRTSLVNPRRWLARPRGLARRIDQRLRPGAWRGLGYWERRARKMGARAVINVGASEEEIAELTDLQRRTLFGILVGELTGDESLALDLGCGPGRFTGELADAIGGRAIGVDPVARLLELAPSHPRVSYRPMSVGRIPLDDEAADMVWVCLVLGGITEPEPLGRTVAEIERVLRPNGVLLLAECTNDKPDLPYWRYRSVEEYRRMFPRVELTERGHYMELDNRVSVLVGRRKPD
jgi:SAM-dependent methyltransferase